MIHYNPDKIREIPMNRNNFRHLPEVIECYRRELEKLKKDKKPKAEIQAMEETIAQKVQLLEAYRLAFPEVK